MPYGTVDTRFDAWLQRIRLIDSNGDSATVNWHQFRHTLGTPRIADETLRREYEEKYEVRFNLEGEAVKVRPDADLSGVEWLAEKIGRRLHAVALPRRHISPDCATLPASSPPRGDPLCPNSGESPPSHTRR
ncbi:hypothetical protein ABZ922_05160 [Streptomyces shenzhenensis]|uniref:hypothetical protein n=1 Tax=Streptomyces shenzhenensis TaxID=943815 RepID=UPI0033D6CDBD